MCLCVCVCEQSTQVSGKKKFICTSYNMIDELANQSIVNNKIIIERIYNCSHSSSFQSITQHVTAVTAVTAGGGEGAAAAAAAAAADQSSRRCRHGQATIKVVRVTTITAIWYYNYDSTYDSPWAPILMSLAKRFQSGSEAHRQIPCLRPSKS